MNGFQTGIIVTVVVIAANLIILSLLPIALEKYVNRFEKQKGKEKIKQ